MAHRTSRRLTAAAMLSCIGLGGQLCLIGCTGGRNASAAGEEARSSNDNDPRFKTADTMTAFLNGTLSSLSAGPDVDAMRDIVNCYYAETPAQERLGSLAKHVLAGIELFDAAMNKFPEEMSEQINQGLASASADVKDVQLRVTQRADQRVTLEAANPTDPQASPTRIQLVQVGDRWWISGYTIEHEPAAADMLKELDKVEKIAGMVGEKFRSLRSRLDSGEFADGDAFGQALMASGMELMFKPEFQELMEAFGGDDGGGGFGGGGFGGGFDSDF